ncbi:MAG: UDP-N-acetylmuramoyl-tripeptide--D-alanyl-D-alanine ligase [Cyanobacteriota bacterium]|nr:UDP-N-acetylmuramoyl-tripeptide--D-alanyl-D-alanine ligase [Cyanobacteriota bacterium]
MVNGVNGSLDILAELLAGQWQQEAATPTFHPQQSFVGISTDSRRIQPGHLFVALRGENFDGHDFVAEARQKGAIAVIADRPVTGSYLQVADTLTAYQQLGQWWRRQFQIPVIAITGSAGKTTTKDMLAAALAGYGNVLKSPANHNNDIGLTQTLLDLTPQHDYAVVELAMRGSGEIGRLTRVAQPTHALITNIGTAHIGRLGSRQAIAQAKCELLGEMTAGVAILNGEDDLLLRTASQVWRGETLTYGLERGGMQGEWDPFTQSVVVEGVRMPVPLAGRHHALNWMAVLASLRVLGLPWQELSHQPIPWQADRGRNHYLSLAGDVGLLDETYNAAPEAMIAALHALKQTPGTRHWAILGGMRELGDFADELYAQVGATAAQLGLYRVLLWDPDQEMAALAQQLPSPTLQVFREAAPLITTLHQEVQAGDRLLFKAARAVQLETIMQAFLTGWDPIALPPL